MVQFPGSGDPPLLLRIPVQTARWAECLPPRPAGATVTVAFSDAEVEAEHGDAVALLGYTSVGVRPSGRDTTPSVDLLIPRAECDRWPLWRDQLLNAGGRVWDLAFGPAAAMLGPAVAVHQRAADGTALRSSG
ncbi:hypothetical protein BH23ACT9_BH23ACT9_08410 [soil metagenome]